MSFSGLSFSLKRFVSVLPGFLFFSVTVQSVDDQRMASDSPVLIVGIVIEKMRYDYINRMWDGFGENGFRRLVNEGTSFSNARYDYLVNQSSSGYATIFSGSNPSVHGIIADRWYERLQDMIRSSVHDDHAVAVGGSFMNGRRSPAMMLAGTIGDELRMANDFRSRIYSVSMRDASAILSGGFSANAACWFDDLNGEWMSSTYYIDSLSAWIRNFNSMNLPDTYLDRIWEPGNGSSTFSGMADSNRDQLFRHDLRRAKRRMNDYSLLRVTPWGNTFTRDFALSLIVNEGLGKRGYTDMLIIGFSSTADIGTRYGTFSRELQDTYLHLDREIAHLLDFLDQNYGKSQILVFLTSDQGVAYPPSYNQYARIAGGTFSPGLATSLLRSYLNVTYGQADWVSSYNAGMVYLNHNLIEDNNIPLSEIQNRSAGFLRQFTGVAGALTGNVLLGNHFTGGINSAIQSGYHPKRSGDIMLYLQQGWHERSLSGDQISLVSYDRHVPLVFYGWNVKPSKILREVSITDIVPTISLALDIPVPPFATGKPIMELFW